MEPFGDVAQDLVDSTLQLHACYVMSSRTPAFSQPWNANPWSTPMLGLMVGRSSFPSHSQDGLSAGRGWPFR